MSKITSLNIRDNALNSIGLFFFFIILQPFGLRDAIGSPLWQSNVLPMIFGECLLIFACSLLADIFVSIICRLPNDYSKEWPYQIKRMTLFYLSLILLIGAVLGIYFTILQYGWEHINYFWHEKNGAFTMKWYMNNLMEDVSVCIFVALIWVFIIKARMKEHRIQELLALNEDLDSSEEAETGKEAEITITGESKESLTISPSDILYIESVANYLVIWYLKDGEPSWKRIRNTLKNVEVFLSGYPFLLHCHRAFLVNTRFITHVDGNSSGCQLHIFSIDKTIPVSKANIDALRSSLHQQNN